MFKLQEQEQIAEQHRRRAHVAGPPPGPLSLSLAPRLSPFSFPPSALPPSIPPLPKPGCVVLLPMLLQHVYAGHLKLNTSAEADLAQAKDDLECAHQEAGWAV